MHTYSIQDARRIILNCAKRYDSNLNNKQYMIVYKDRSLNEIQNIEISFLPENFQHLTGIELVDEEQNVRRNVAGLFYRKCINNTLRKEEICFRKDGTTQLKLLALPALVDMQKITKIAGDYNNSRAYLFVDKLVGNINFCLGLRRLGNGEYTPVSALLEDIKKLSVNQSQVLAIFSREIGEAVYQNIRYVAKGINLKHLNLPDKILKNISLEKYIAKK